jgi:predicted nucleic acid-binding protein
MSLVFADAFYFVARLNARDQHHDRVVAFSRTFRASILTTEWVLMEVGDALAKSDCRSRVRDFVIHLRQAAVCEIVAASSELFDRALALYHQHSDKDWTLTDCTSILIMRERGLTSVLTADHHFEQAGFQALLK